MVRIGVALRSTVLRYEGGYFGLIHADPTDPQVPNILADLSSYASGVFFVGGWVHQHKGTENPIAAFVLN